MKLQKFNAENMVSIRPLQPIISISCKHGLISLSKEASSLLDLKEGSKLNFHQDEARPKDWYIEVTNEEDGFQLRTYKSRLVFSSKGLSKLLLKSLDTTRSQRIPIAKEQTGGLWAILTSKVSSDR